MKEILRGIWRAIRVAVAYAGGAFLAKLLEQPQITALGITAIISGVFKILRDKFPKLWWLPV